MLNITFQQMEMFLAVAEKLNFSATADALYISQPVLSKTIRRLEASIGVQLFYRSNRGVSLTEAGRYLYLELKRPFRKITRCVETVQQMQVRPRRQLKIGYPSSFDYNADFDGVRAAVRRFRAENPEIEVTELLYEFVPLREALLYAEVDLVIGQSMLANRLEGVSARRIAPFHMYVALSAGHPLAAVERLEPAMLADEVFYEVFCYSPTEEESERMRSAWGFTPKIQYLPNFQTLIRALSQKQGVSFCGKFDSVATETALQFRPLPAHPTFSNSYIAALWRSGDLSAAARRLLELLPAYADGA